MMKLIVENNRVLLSLLYFVKVILQKEVSENFAESVQFKGTIFFILKQGGGVGVGGGALQIKVAGDQENIFHLELCLNKA